MPRKLKNFIINFSTTIYWIYCIAILCCHREYKYNFFIFLFFPFLCKFWIMSYNSKDARYLFSKDFWARDILKKMSWDILRICSSHVLCAKCVLKFSKVQDRPLLTNPFGLQFGENVTDHLLHLTSQHLGETI